METTKSRREAADFFLNNKIPSKKDRPTIPLGQGVNFISRVANRGNSTLKILDRENFTIVNETFWNHENFTIVAGKNWNRENFTIFTGQQIGELRFSE